MYTVTPPVALSPGELVVIREEPVRLTIYFSQLALLHSYYLRAVLTTQKSQLPKTRPEATHTPPHNISHYLREEVLPDKDEGRDVQDASTSTPVSSSNDPNLLEVFTGSSWPFARLSPPPFLLRCWSPLQRSGMLPVSGNRQHASTQPPPLRQWPCAWEQRYRPGATGRDSGLRTGP